MRFLPLYLFPPTEARKGRPGALTKLGDTPRVAAEIIFKVKCESKTPSDYMAIFICKQYYI
jgi:hypothetical protein